MVISYEIFETFRRLFGEYHKFHMKLPLVIYHLNRTPQKRRVFSINSVVAKGHYLDKIHCTAYWLATSGGRVPVVAVCVLYGQLRICCVTESATL